MKPIAKLLCGALLTGALALCSVATQAQTPKGDGGTIRMMASPFGSQSFIPFTMKKYNLDTKYGFKLDVIPYSDLKTLNAAIQGGSAEIGVFDWIQVALMRNGGLDVIGVAPFLTYVTSTVVPVDSQVKTAKDLVGKKFGVFARTSIDWILTAAAAKHAYGVDLATAAQIQEGAPPLLRGALEQGRLDATLMYSSIAPDMIATGKFKNVFTVRDSIEQLGLPVSPYLVLATTEKYAKAHPDNVRAFVAAYRETVELLKSDDSIWTEQGEKMKLVPDALKIYRDEIRVDILKSFQKDTNDVLKKTFDILIDAAGPKTIGLEKLPENLVTTDYQ